jgi:hypothetical protein
MPHFSHMENGELPQSGIPAVCWRPGTSASLKDSSRVGELFDTDDTGEMAGDPQPAWLDDQEADAVRECEDHGWMQEVYIRAAENVGPPAPPPG